jgi:transcriptional regulator with XRE-family HTH domain
MSEKQERLKEVYDYVRSNCAVHTQIDFAARLKMTRQALSAAINGNESYLTTNLFQKICAAFPGVFNLDYLLTGQGELLMPAGAQPEPTTPKPSASVDVDFYHKALENYSNMVADLRKDKEYFQQLVLDKDSALMENNEQVVAMRTHIAKLETELEHTKNTLAAVRKNYDQQVETIKLLQAALAQYKSDKFPYSTGVADGNNEHVHIATDGK